MKKNAANDARYRRKTAKNGQFYFTLVAANGETIGTSEMYTSEHGRDGGIEAVKKVAPAAPVEEIS